MAELIGRHIGGRYEITKLLGEGGMAEVYEAIQTKVNRHVAIKVLHRHLSNDEQFRTRFEREASAIANLKHPNIIQLYDFDLDDSLNQYYMVIEYVDGPTLNDLMKRTRSTLPLQQSLQIITDLANALGYAHEKGMQHRDIKPSNVMLDGGTRTILMDFGIAKLMEQSGQQLTASGAMIGTPAYISPEQAAGVPGDHRSDIYSLGIVFYQLATGRLPYQGETPIATILKHMKEPPLPPRQWNAELPAGVEAIILRCLAKDPDDRYDTIQDMLKHLSNLELAATDLDQIRTVSGKVLTDEFLTTPTTYDSSANVQTITDTLTTSSKQTNLFITAGAVAIIALLVLGAILFSTAGTANDIDTIVACQIVLDEPIQISDAPSSDANSVVVDAQTTVTLLETDDDFILIRTDDAEGWTLTDSVPIPDDCQLNS